MSTDQAALHETKPFKEARSRRRRQIILAEGGVYGRNKQATTEPELPTNTCLTCRRDVPSPVARVVGDNDGNVEVCHDCWIGNGNESYSNISRAVRRYRAGYGQPHPEYRGDGQ
jgi:hypothetical protein